MATTKSNLITNLDAVPSVFNDVGLSGGRVRIAMDNFEVTAADFDADGDIITLCRLPVNARVLSIKLWADAMGTSAAPNCGIYSGTTIKDEDFFATAVDTASAVAASELRFEAADANTAGDKLWENAGDSANPGGHYDIALTQTASVSGGSDFTVAFEVLYTID
jgi:hypothetical protein|tara:strand:+ start:1819 stop:2310 length:492 start_codon:yes stop_codon:yes gene_type:complete